MSTDAQHITTERIERALDRLAEIMVELGERGAHYLPIYERLEREIAERKALENKMAAVHDRVKQLKDRKVAIPAPSLPALASANRPPRTPAGLSSDPSGSS